MTLGRNLVAQPGNGCSPWRAKAKPAEVAGFLVQVMHFFRKNTVSGGLDVIVCFISNR